MIRQIEEHVSNSMTRMVSQTAGIILALIIGIGLSFFQTLLAQDMLFSHYTVDDGLCSNTVTSIGQDTQGFMWFGTKNGLSRFDGYEFRSFQHSEDSFSIGANFIRIIYPLDERRQLIGTNKGIYAYDHQTERFTPFKSFIDGRVNGIAQDNYGNLYISSNTSLFCFKAAGQWQEYSRYAIEAEVRSMVIADDGQIWLATYGKGITVFDPATTTFTNYQSNDFSSLPTNYILTLFKSLEGDIWAGTLTGGLCRWDSQQRQFITYQHRQGENTISSNIVRAIAQRKPGELLIGTEKGLNVLDLATQKFSHFAGSNFDVHSLNDNAVWSIFIDKQQNIWLGTYFGGINFTNRSKARFSYYYPTIHPNAMKGKAVSAFLEDQGNLWVGTEDAGLHYFDKAAQKFYQYPFRPHQEKLSYYNVHALMKDRDGKIWVGTYSAGLDVLDSASGKVHHYRSNAGDPNALSNNSVYSLLQDRQGDIWVGTIGGLNLYDEQHDQFIPIKEQHLDNRVIHQMIEDRNGNIWVPTYGDGLYVRGTGNNQWTHFPPEQSGEKVIALCEDKKGRIWIGTEGSGLSSYQQGQFTHFRHAVPLNTIYSIVEDDTGNLWLSSDQGLYCFNPDTGKKIHFRNWDYLQSDQYNYGAGTRTSDGTIYFGGINGFNSFNPDTLLQYYNQQVAPLYITSIELFNHPVSIDPDGNGLTKSASYAKEFVLDHHQSMVTFSYASLDYAASQALSYAYKMEGFDEHWNQVGNQRRATYTNLPPGQYTFLVKATKGEDKPAIASLQITIHPPFYQTKTAYVIYMVSVLLFIAIANRKIRQKAEQRNRQKLEQMKRWEERAFYKQKIEFFTEMAHEIRTPLSLIMAPLEKLLTSERDVKTGVRKQLHIMQENSEQLSSLINQLLDFRRIESEQYSIAPEKTELVNLVQNIYSRFSGVAYQKGIRYSFSTDTDRLEVMVDPEAMTKILNNLLINSFKFARNSVTVAISTEADHIKQHPFFYISVEDDGIGIPKKDLHYIFDKFFKVTAGSHQYNNLGGTGIGLFLAKSLSEMHGGNLRVTSQENAFTRFMVEIPLETVSEESQPEMRIQHGHLENIDEKAPRLLIAEDNPSLMNFLVQSFQEQNYMVFSAANGKIAVEILNHNQIDIILTDVLMPEMDGLELCKYVKSNINLRQIPIILLTAKSDPETEMDGLEIGADAFVVKPFKFKHLDLVVKNLLDNRKLLKLRFSHQPLSVADGIANNTKDEKFLQQVIAEIEQNISNSDYSVAELSEVIGVSRSGMHKRLKNISGLGPSQFIKLIRLKHSARLLQAGNYNISEVGYLSGFSSPSYFSKCFHQQFNMTPKDFIINETEQTDSDTGS